MNISEGLTVTIITAVNNAAYLGNGLSIDGSSQTVNWVGGCPTDGGSGVDIILILLKLQQILTLLLLIKPKLLDRG